VSGTRELYLGGTAPAPLSDADGLQAPFWDGLRRGELRIQRCRQCKTWIFAPEWICHACHGLDLDWECVEPAGRLYSWTRVWRAVSPAMAAHVPYVAAVVELPQAGGVRLIGNLLGDAAQPVEIGARVEGVLEHHADFSLLQWRPARP